MDGIEADVNGESDSVGEGSLYSITIPAGVGGSSSLSIKEKDATAALWSGSGTAPAMNERMSIIVHGEKGKTDDILAPGVTIVGDNWIGSAAAVATPCAAVTLAFAAVLASLRQ